MVCGSVAVVGARFIRKVSNRISRQLHDDWLLLEPEVCCFVGAVSEDGVAKIEFGGAVVARSKAQLSMVAGSDHSDSKSDTNVNV